MTRKAIMRQNSGYKSRYVKIVWSRRFVYTSPDMQVDKKRH